MIIDTDLLVGVADIAEIFDVGYSAVSNWQRRYDDFPEPVVVVSNGNIKLWDERDILHWAALSNQPQPKIRRRPLQPQEQS